MLTIIKDIFSISVIIIKKPYTGGYKAIQVNE